jgi:mannose-1-phosphate guanylyltransferase/phosphomannomutase
MLEPNSSSDPSTLRKAVIMAGGFGTRLRPLTCNLPKPVVPMMAKPMMHHIVELLKTYGVREVTSLLYYQPEEIKGYFGDGKKFGVKMSYMIADADYGTAGSVKNAAVGLGALDERFIVISGDVLTDFNLAKALEYHRKNKSMATMILTHAKNPLQFGVVMTAKDGKVTRFLEKPSWGEVFSDTINTGIYILEKEVLDLIPYQEDFDFSKDLFPKMLKQNLPLYGYIADGYWRDIGTLSEYQEAHLDALAGRVKLDFSEGYEKIADKIFIHKSARFDKEKVKFSGSVYIGKNARILENAHLKNCVIGESVSIGENSSLENTVIWERTTIGKDCDISASVLCKDVKVHDGVRIDERCFISDGCIIGKDAHIREGVKLWPEKEIESDAILSQSLVWESKWARELFTGARITGISNIEITSEFAAKLGTAFGSLVGEGNTVSVSRDADKVSRMINRALISGIMSAGVTVNDLQATPIPIARHTLKNTPDLSGLHTRRSPFDKKLVDIIFLDRDGKDFPTGRTKSVERLFFGEEYKRASFENIGSLNFPERAMESYTDSFLKAIDTDVIKKANLKIVVDYSNGAASTIFPNILGSLGVEVISLNAYLDSKKFTRDADEFFEAADRLSEIVISLRNDIGFMLDAGAERVFVSDEKGDFFEYQRLLTLVVRLYLGTYPETKKIAVSVTASQEVEDVCKEFGVEVVRTGDNHSDLMRAVTSDPEIGFAGGTTGGFIFPKFLFACDGMFSVVKILELMAKSKTRLGLLSEQYPELYSLVKRNASCPKDLKGKVMRKIMEDTASHYRILVDGVKIVYDNETSLLLLPDRERDIFHINGESKSKAKATRLVSEYEKKIKGWVSE